MRDKEGEWSMIEGEHAGGQANYIKRGAGCEEALCYEGGGRGKDIC
jgi:hypothetical protein